MSIVDRQIVPARRPSADHAASPEAVTELVLRIFRVNGRLLAAGDRLVAPLGLTSARWQVLGAIAAAEQPQPVVQLAREMAVSRQAVQRIANDLERDGLIAFEANPRHKRAQLVMFTDRGRTLYEEALKLQRPWVAGLADGLTDALVEAACASMDVLLDRLDDRGIPADE